MRLFAQMRGWKGHGAILAIALLLLAAPRLITAAPLDMLDGEQSRSLADPAEDAGANFPGSAFFYAQGAFDPVPGVVTVQSEHVLGLDEVKAAPATVFRGLTGLDSYRALNCLTSAIYYEAANEPDDGQRAVAQVVLNRVRSQLWPDTVCGVVYQGSERRDYKCQFTFSCDGAMARVPAAAAWVRARRVAQDALAGKVYAPVGLATHYHTLAVRPDWSSSLQAVAVIGAHIFYRNPGFNGTPAAFAAPYLGRETISGPARTSWPARPVQPVEMLAAPYTPPVQALPPMTPRTGWTPVPPPQNADDGLPESTIRPEYRNSGRPLI
ncbi:cell wall hydrolase [Sphingobium cupriresistens]|uniref:Cell wall hydrolase n=1 Tax=Sphingobium cupriresistens TaxID=1132417 RepID=A0A8G1ZGC1_9SPHN|nr:cell wall hydrolase [Sphingobium cupriresistens]RYM10158.1 cell wall hydrolase [Sphingobium cupriresistens]